MKKTRKFRSPTGRLILTGLIALIGIGAYALKGPISNLDPGEYKVKSRDVSVIGPAVENAVSLGRAEKNKAIESKPIKADFQFNAIAPHWKEANATEENRTVAIRTSLDNQNWGPWLEIEAVGPLRDDDPHPDRMFAETPMFIDGRYFQYKITLNRDSLDQPAPEIYDMKINHIDSRKPALVSMAEKVRGLFKSDKAQAAQNHPRIITRSQWGSPDPNGTLFKGTDKYWQPVHYPVSQVFIHHTVTPSYQADPSAAVRAIWDFHANTRGWGDIGYNYLLDHQGNVYEGRVGGDNAVGGHVLSYNRGALGVALLGCFEPADATCNELNGGNTAAPAAAVQSGLVNLLGNKTASFEIDPVGSHTFCKYTGDGCLNLPVITGHRDANQTGCPGSLTVNSLQNIRDNTVAAKNGGWNYSAKQLSYNTADFSTNSSIDVTLQFKNTGALPWTNTGNKTSLFTMEPPGRTSPFQGTGWLSNTKPAVLNEASVAPGQVGSFTFNIKRPNLPSGYYTEGFTLITDDGNTPGAHYVLPINLDCSIGRASNPRANGSLIRASDGRVHLIEAGNKRHITSLLAAYTAGFNLQFSTEVSSDELSLLPTGTPISLREGTLLKSSASPNVYILDETPGGFVKRLVTSVETMSAFGMKFNQVHTVDTAVLTSYADGAQLTPASAVPDGRLIKEPGDHKVYLTQGGAKRWITSILVFDSNGFQSQHIGTVAQQKITALTDGGAVLIRTGTLLKASGTTSIYVTDIIAGAGQKRLITNYQAFEASGFRSELIRETGNGVLDAYATASNIECFK